jgi:DNA-binding CsgD family transcriptional regulator
MKQDLIYQNTCINGVLFTKREFDVIACIINGCTSRKSIANVLSISVGTVATHMVHIRNKLQCSSWEQIRDQTLNTEYMSILRSHFDHYINQKGFYHAQ